MQAAENLWIVPAGQSPDEAIIAACDGDVVVASILLNRGFTDPDRIRAFLHPELYQPSAPEQLPDLVHAAEMLRDAIQAQRRILIWGDFDVDGQTATALLVDGLQRLGANIAWYVPDRAAESHGIHVDSLQRQIEAHHPEILLTCDTGISEFEAIDYARSAGLKVIVTDHHEMADRLPEADAVINPVRLPHNHPMANLPGVGVAYKLIQYLAYSLERPTEPPRLLDLVALGIVGDVATQTDDTRYLLQIGLERLRKTERIGLQALMEVASLSPLALTAEQIGFQLGPRLSAAGRLTDASLSVELLITHDRVRARLLAQQLEGLNNERRAQTRQIESAAREIIARDASLLDYAALVLYQPNWNPGILGIVASRLAERYHRPVVLLAGKESEEGGLARGSARSIDGVDINQAITAQADLLRTYGGHPGAAGLSLAVKHIDTLRTRLSQSILGAARQTAPTIATVKIDMMVSLDALTLSLAQSIRKLAPFGEGNPSVTLGTPDLRLTSAAFIGRAGLHRKLIVEDAGGHQQTLLWWGGANEALPSGVFDAAYHLSVNERQDLEATVVDFRRRPETEIEVKEASIHLFDWRHEADPVARLESVLAEAPDSLVWAEAFSRQDHPTYKRRAELSPASTLVIYSVPPDPVTLRAALDTIRPQVLHVIATDPPLRTVPDFIAQLTTAVRNVLDRLDGKVNLAVLCGATASSPQVVRAGLDYLVAVNKVGEAVWQEGDMVTLSPPSSRKPVEETVDRARAALEIAYREMEAYRRYFKGMPLDRLVR